MNIDVQALEKGTALLVQAVWLIKEDTLASLTQFCEVGYRPNENGNSGQHLPSLVCQHMNGTSRIQVLLRLRELIHPYLPDGFMIESASVLSGEPFLSLYYGYEGKYEPIGSIYPSRRCVQIRMDLIESGILHNQQTLDEMDETVEEAHRGIFEKLVTLYTQVKNALPELEQTVEKMGYSLQNNR